MTDLSTIEENKLLDLVLAHGRGRPTSMASCLGCEEGLPWHLMSSEDADDPRAIRVYARSARDFEALAGVLLQAKLRDLTVIEEAPRDGRRDLIIYVE